MASAAVSPGDRFSLVQGGPFHTTLGRMGLVGADGLPTQSAAIGLALLDYGRLCSQHHLAFHRRWVGEKRNGEALMGSSDPSSASDLNASV